MEHYDLDNVKFSDMAGSASFKGADLKEEGPVELTVKNVKPEMFKDEDGSGQEVQKWYLYFEEDERKCPLNFTRLSTMKDLFGMPPSRWLGQRVRLFPTRVTFGTKMVDAIGLDGVSDHDPARNAAPSRPAPQATTQATPGAAMTQATRQAVIAQAVKMWGSDAAPDMLKSFVRRHLNTSFGNGMSEDQAGEALRLLKDEKPTAPADEYDDADPFADPE